MKISADDWHFRSSENDTLVLDLFLSNAQPDLAMAEAYSKRILQLAKAHKVETIISFASMPQPIEHTQEPGVWFCATTAELNNSLKKYGLNFFSDSQISGMNSATKGSASGG